MRQRFNCSLSRTLKEWTFEKLFRSIFFWLIFFIAFRIRTSEQETSGLMEETIIALFCGLLVIIGTFLYNFFYAVPLRMAIKAKDKAEKENLELRQKISNDKYQDGAVIEGGTHNIYDIFGRDDTRRDMTFRNCTIEGKGMVGITRANRDNMEINFHLTGGSMVMKRGPDIATSVKEFYECGFEGVTFRDIMILGHGNQEMIRDGFTAFDNEGLVRAITQERIEEYVLENLILNAEKLAVSQKRVARSGPILLEQIEEKLEELKVAKNNEPD